MGRFYSGDIEGKFWFAVQSSDDADFFGSKGYQPERLEYYFDKDHLDSVKEGITKCKETLGVYKEKMDEFFKALDYYSDKDLATYLDITENDAKKYLEWYARLELGEKILNSLEESGQCWFEAEC